MCAIPCLKIVSILARSAEERNAAFHAPEKREKITGHIRYRVHPSPLKLSIFTSEEDQLLLIPLSFCVCMQVSNILMSLKTVRQSIVFQKAFFFLRFLQNKIEEFFLLLQIVSTE